LDVVKIIQNKEILLDLTSNTDTMDQGYLPGSNEQIFCKFPARTCISNFDKIFTECAFMY